MNPFPSMFVAIVVALFVLVIAVALLRNRQPVSNVRITRATYGDSEREDDLDRPAVTVDPWDLQRTLMAASDQEMPPAPTVTKTTLLYWALIAEEYAETSDALLAALDRTWGTREHRLHGVPIAGCLRDFQDGLRYTAGMLHRRASIAKALLREIDHVVPIQLLRSEACGLIDGTTDITVVNSGFALATGLPGAESYLRVQVSNLSKRNERGVIDKTPDGKWIKGPGYAEPDLAALVAGCPEAPWPHTEPHVAVA